MRNAVIREDKIKQRPPFVRFLDLTRWWNESAESTLFLGPLSAELKEGAILSDLMLSPNTFSSSQFEKLLGRRGVYRGLMLHRNELPGLKELQAEEDMHRGIESNPQCDAELWIRGESLWEHKTRFLVPGTRG
jgi:hypothetical protein